MDHEEPQLSHIKEDSNKPKKKKKKKRKKGKSKRSESRIPRRYNGKSYGAGPYGRHNRRESTPHHATVHSLASINQPIIVNKLSKMSQDLKYQREIQKAMMELKQKDEDYRYAIEIGESLTKENTFLKEQIEILESQLHHQETDNTILKEKLETLHSTYSHDLSSYHQELQQTKQLVSELQTALQSKQQELSQQKEINKSTRNDIQNISMTKSAMLQFERMTSDEIQNLPKNNMGSLEKQLFEQLEKQKKRYAESQQTIESLVSKLDDMHTLKRKYDALKKSNKELKQITKDELAQHISMQKSIEQQAIYLSARNANMEEEREDLLNLLDQREYEITMLQQQLTLERKETNRTLRDASIEENTLGDDIVDQDDDEQYYVYDDGHEEHEEEDGNDMDQQEEIDIIADILDDENIFLSDEDDSEELQIEGTNATHKRKHEEEKVPEETRDKKAFDKIKEYLHLSASAVKIKYPTVKNIQSDELIKKVRDLPFYKYHDQMVRIMEQQIKKSNNNKDNTMNRPRPQLEKRKSFLSIFNIFGKDELDAVSDSEEAVSDAGSDRSANEDAGISARRSRKKKKSKKKSKKRKSIPNIDSGSPQQEFRQVRGLSAQAQHKRLNQ